MSSTCCLGRFDANDKRAHSLNCRTLTSTTKGCCDKCKQVLLVTMTSIAKDNETWEQPQCSSIFCECHKSEPQEGHSPIKEEIFIQAAKLNDNSGTDGNRNLALFVIALTLLDIRDLLSKSKEEQKEKFPEGN